MKKLQTAFVVLEEIDNDGNLTSETTLFSTREQAEKWFENRKIEFIETLKSDLELDEESEKDINVTERVENNIYDCSPRKICFINIDYDTSYCYLTLAEKKIL